MIKKLLYITNIPTPYRNFRFNALADICHKNGLSLHVLYMNESEPDRTWQINYEDMQHTYTVFSRQTVKKALGMWMHVTPGLQRFLLRTDYDIAVLGGLASPAHFLSALILSRRRFLSRGRFLSRKQSYVNVLSVESNIASIGNHSGIASRVKTFLMKRFRYFQVTGDKAADFIRHYVGAVPDDCLVTLPNVINEPLFLHASPVALPQIAEDAIKRAREEGKKVLLIPARLIEEKGLLPFFKALNKEDTVCVLIAGEGPLRAAIERQISERELNVVLLGAQTPEVTSSLMKSVDFLCLPSKSDPSPLSVIEACACGLPILASRNIGNFTDVIDEGINGWGFDFNNTDSARQALKQLYSVSKAQRADMALHARQKFNETFHSEKALQHYVDELKKLANL